MAQAQCCMVCCLACCGGILIAQGVFSIRLQSIAFVRLRAKLNSTQPIRVCVAVILYSRSLKSISCSRRRRRCIILPSDRKVL